MDQQRAFLRGGTDAGSDIAFVSDRDKDLEIYVMNADGSGQARPPTTRASTTRPSGHQVVTHYLRSDRAGNTNSYSIRPDGNDESFSPDQNVICGRLLGRVRWLK